MTTAAETLESRREVLALRRFVRERAAGRVALEWVVYDPALGAWLASSEAEATTSGRDWRRVRRPGEPWCAVLGRDLTVARDDALQAVFVTHEPDDLSAWRRMFIDIDRAPERCLSDWRARGRRLLAAVSDDPAATGGNLAARFTARGTGKRGLAGV